MQRLLIALLSLFAIGAAAPPAAKDWRSNVVEGAAGWTFGKPGAPLLTEYASLGCPHCGHFAAETGARIDSLVKAGKLRFAFRPFLIFPHDRAGTVLARCVAPSRRLAFLEQMFAKQAETKAALTAADADETARGRIYAAELAGPRDHARALAEAGGLLAIAAQNGLTATAAQQCLASQAAHDWVTNADLTSRTSGVTGTPTYELRGVRLDSELTPDQLLAKLPR